MSRRIVVSRPDAERLRGILRTQSASSQHDREHLLDLQQEIETASIVEVGQLPADVVTMDSTVRVCDVESGLCGEYTLVPPSQARLEAGRLSVLAPLGTALLGYREGDHVMWRMPGGLRSLWIQKVSQDPAIRGPAPRPDQPAAA